MNNTFYTLKGKKSESLDTNFLYGFFEKTDLVSPAAATIVNSEKLVIIMPHLFENIKEENDKFAIIAHEMGHNFHEHSQSGVKGRSEDYEYEADLFAANILGKEDVINVLKKTVKIIEETKNDPTLYKERKEKIDVSLKEVTNRINKIKSSTVAVDLKKKKEFKDKVRNVLASFEKMHKEIKNDIPSQKTSDIHKESLGLLKKEEVRGIYAKAHNGLETIYLVEARNNKNNSFTFKNNIALTKEFFSEKDPSVQLYNLAKTIIRERKKEKNPLKQDEEVSKMIGKNTTLHALDKLGLKERKTQLKDKNIIFSKEEVLFFVKNNLKALKELNPLENTKSNTLEH